MQTVRPILLAVGQQQLNLLITSAAVAIVLSPFSASANNEGMLFVVGDHDHPDACGGSDFGYHYNSGNHFYYKWGDWNFDRRPYYDNRGVDFRDLADQSVDPDGRDHLTAGADSADVVYVYSHGGARCESNHRYSHVKMGDDSGTCSLRYGNPDLNTRNDVLWGNTDVDWMIIDSCKSAEECVFNPGGYDKIGTTGLVGLLGFHGCSFDGYAHSSKIGTFVANSRYDGLGDNWVDGLTTFYSGDDECATAVIYGSSGSQRDYVYNNAGFQDRKSNTTNTGNELYYVDNCNPRGSSPIN